MYDPIIPVSQTHDADWLALIFIALAIAAVIVAVASSPYTRKSRLSRKVLLGDAKKDVERLNYERALSTSKSKNKALDAELKRATDNLRVVEASLPPLVARTGWKRFRVAVALALTAFLTLSFLTIAVKDELAENAVLKSQWAADTSEWAEETYGVDSSFADFEYKDSGGIGGFGLFGGSVEECNPGTIQVSECVYGEVIVNSKDSRRVEKVALIYIGKTPILIDAGGNELNRITDKPMKIQKIDAEDKNASHTSEILRADILPALQERYDIKDALIPSRQEDCEFSDTCYAIAFISSRDEVGEGIVTLIDGEYILVSRWNNQEYDESKSAFCLDDPFVICSDSDK